MSVQVGKQPVTAHDSSGSSQSSKPSSPAPQEKSFQISAPLISLPKGGGAIRGMGEKFAANPVTGTGSMSVPIATSPGRSGFGPQLFLSYDSGAGNGPFGFGWSLSLPSITRKTDKGLPKYQDADDSDVFILSGSEDLVPTLRKRADGKWEPEVVSGRTVGGQVYHIRRYRPRLEGLFARIERWSNISDSTDVFWRSISKDNITTWYGKTAESRIQDPADPARIFSWLICETYDDKGNVITYAYKAENSADMDASQVHERNRSVDQRKANRYLKYIRYGNHEPYLPKLSETAPWPTLPPDDKWYFQVVFDYGEHALKKPTPSESGPWPRRNDPFSSYRAGFEVRTYRLCQRVLMFHHFPGEENVGQDCLVRSTDFNYEYEDDPKIARAPIYSFLTSVSQSGYVRQGERYLMKSLPPVEFEYSHPIVQDAIEEVDPASLENLPIGLDGTVYQWTDLHGEGTPGILTEQGGAWFYKRNWSPIPVKQPDDTYVVKAKFSAVETVALKPNVALNGGAQFMDLAGDGQPDLVLLDGPTPGLYEHDHEEGWESFRPFTARLNRDTRDPNLKFVDLDGDGHADVLITEDDAFVWHPSLAEEGFGPARRVAQSWDEEKGPRLVFADGEQSIYLADLSGDGLTDLVRIRNGEVCYWPNVGYGRFGAKVTMDGSPQFDHPDCFDQKRIRLADIDGSGTTDIIYLHRDGIRLYFNQSGNSWSLPHTLNVFPRIDDLVSIIPVDLLGNGTACLVWSSSLPGDARRPMRYVNLMGGQKPHLLIKTKNNLGAETAVSYAPSTKFYLQDKKDGKPWISRLPFPVHVVERVTLTDKWRKTSFSSTYSYHHGYFDGEEREFRGFGRVEQIDVESYGKFKEDNPDSPYITDDQTLYQPPVKTTTWYHTGAFLDRERVLMQFEDEYFPRWLEELHPGLNIAFTENPLPQPDLQAEDLTVDEWRQALRACKGMMLRQEVVELDIDELEDAKDPQLVPIKVFSTAYHNCHIRRLQPQMDNRHAVFVAVESEAITYHYELDIQPSVLEKLQQDAIPLKPDPRIAHTLNLQHDEYGNALQSVAVAYPRMVKFQEGSLDIEAVNQIQAVQNERHLAYSEIRYTQDFGIKPGDEIAGRDNHRLRVPCEVLTYELTGITPQSGPYFTLDELQGYRLSLVHQSSGEVVKDISYHQLPDPTIPPKKEKRLVEHARTLFFSEDLQNSLPFGDHGRLGITFENYKLALTKSLLDAIFTDTAANNTHTQTVNGTKTALEILNEASTSGYLSGSLLTDRFDTIPAEELEGQYWICSGIAGFAPDAAQHFYLPERYTDPFGNTTRLEYDPRDLFIASSTDAKDNVMRVEAFDFRMLAPRRLKDINENLSEVVFDVLGLPTAMAVKGKGTGTEGDNLNGFTNALVNPESPALQAFFVEKPYDEAQARGWLGNATARHVYYFGEIEEKLSDGRTVIHWGQHPACACGIVRERHVASLQAGEVSPIQAAFEYSDGMGSVLVKKGQAEPEDGKTGLRWIASGKTILNNKGKPVKQYEPYFSLTEHHFDETEAEAETGVTPVMYYDAPGRLIRTEMPDGSFSRVEFSPWHVKTFDANDTVLESRWYSGRNPLPHDQPLPEDPITHEIMATPDQRAAWLAAQDADTPAQVHLDSLGREVIAIAHNRTKGVDESYLTFTKLDAEGKPLWIRDARGNIVMRYTVPRTSASDPLIDFYPTYDIAGNLLFQHSMDAGDRWMLNDAAGKPMFAWDVNERHDGTGVATSEQRTFFTRYDALHQPTELSLTINGGTAQIIERFVYLDGPGGDIAKNLRGQLREHYDQSGLTHMEAYDFKGQPLEVHRQLAVDYKAPVIHWLEGGPSSGLEAERFVKITEYDALGRMTRLYNWHHGVGSRVAVYEPKYSERGVLKSEELVVGATKTATGYSEGVGSKRDQVIQDITYDAKGQRLSISYGNNTVTRYHYDPETFRLLQLRTTRTVINPEFPKEKGFKDPHILQNLYYTYDPVGNITKIYDDAVEPAYFKNQKVKSHNLYTYDALYRLLSGTGRENSAAVGMPGPTEPPPMVVQFPITDPNALRNYTEHYVYDQVGNIREMAHVANGGSWTRYYEYATDSNRLLKTWEGSNTIEAVNYGYDTHGSMLNYNNVAPRQLFQWDYRDMIHAIDLVGGGQVYYNYDAGKQRTRKVIESQTGTKQWERLDLGGLEVFRKYSGGTVVEEIETLHLMDGQTRVLLVEDVKQTDNAQLGVGILYRYQYGNHLGSIGIELNEQSQIISSEEFYPYGTSAYGLTSRSIKCAAKRFRFNGKERDEESGLGYHTARYYASWVGRWISCDPNGIDDGVNLYRFTQCHPLRFTDPNGTTTISESGDPPPQEQPQITVNKAKGAAAHEALQRQVESKGHGVRSEVVAKGGKGGSRVDISPDPNASQTIAKTLESKHLDLNAYRDTKGNLDSAKLSRTIQEHIIQVQKHQMALREGRVPDMPFRESLVYTLENAKPGEAVNFQELLRNAAPKGMKGGVLQLEKGVLKTASGRVLSAKAMPAMTAGNVLIILINPEFVNEFSNAATGADLEARAKHSDVFHMSGKQRDKLKEQIREKRQEESFNAEVEVAVLGLDVSDEKAEEIVRQERAAVRADVREFQKQYPGPVLSKEYYVPPEKSRWEKFKAWVNRQMR